MNLISVKSGKANTRDATSECYVFFTPRPSVEGDNCVETFIGKAAREFRGHPMAPVKEHGGAIVVPSLSNRPAEVGGQFGQATYQVRDGVIIKIVSKKRAGWNGTLRTSVVFLKARENAAHRTVTFRPVPNNALSLSALGVQGRFDIITMAEAEAFGAKINPMTRKLSEGTDDSIVEFKVLEEETMAPVSFVEVGKSGKLMPVIARRRKIEDV